MEKTTVRTNYEHKEIRRLFHQTKTRKTSFITFDDERGKTLSFYERRRLYPKENGPPARL